MRGDTSPLVVIGTLHYIALSQVKGWWDAFRLGVAELVWVGRLVYILGS